MKEIRDNARQLMQGYCRVCPVCDGRVCSGEVPGMGGLGTGRAFKANLDALGRLRLNMRLLHDVQTPNTKVTVLGKELSMPVLAAPIGGISFNMGGKVSEEDYIASVLGGCIGQGTLGGVGDGVPDFIHQAGYAAIKAHGGEGIPFIKPWGEAELNTKLQKALETGAEIIGMDVDAAGLVTLKLMGRPVTPKTPEQLREFLSRSSAKLILKGIMTKADALIAADAGVHAIVVSNHGGRVLEHAPGAAEVLPEIAAAVKGRITILADGGVRSGGDVLKLLALGADAVMIGRPIAVAAIGGLQEGVEKYLQQIKSELISSMVLTGTSDVTRVSPEILRPMPV